MEWMKKVKELKGIKEEFKKYRKEGKEKRKKEEQGGIKGKGEKREEVDPDRNSGNEGM